MSLIESAPQKPKKFDGRKQDHGDAHTQGQHFRDTYEQIKSRQKVERNRGMLLTSELNEAGEDYSSMTPRELEEATDRLLDLAAFPETSWSSHGALGAESDDEYPIEPTATSDRLLTEAELGVRSKHDIRNEMARRVTLDVDYEDDDNGDSDYNIPVHIRNRL